MRAYLTGAVSARAGDEMSGPALLLAGYAVAGSTAHASALLAGLTASAALGGPLLGVLLDRTQRPGRLLAMTLLMYAAGLTIVLATLDSVPLGVSVLLAILTGLMGPAISGGWTAQLPRVVDADRLPRATALDAMSFSAASLVGPALAGGLAELLGAPAAVIIAAAAVALAVPLAWSLPGVTRPLGRRERPSVGTEVLAGLRFAVANPPLFRATLTSVVSFVAVGMTTACLPLIGETVFGGAGYGAWLLSCAAGAALVANGVLARHPTLVKPDTALWMSTVVLGSAVALLAWGQPFVAIVAAVLIGLGEGPQLTALFAIRHREAPERLRAQIFTTGASLKISAFAAGAALAGPLSERSLTVTLLVAAGVHLLAALPYVVLSRPGKVGARRHPGASAGRVSARRVDQ